MPLENLPEFDESDFIAAASLAGDSRSHKVVERAILTKNGDGSPTIQVYAVAKGNFGGRDMIVYVTTANEDIGYAMSQLKWKPVGSDSDDQWSYSPIYVRHCNPFPQR